LTKEEYEARNGTPHSVLLTSSQAELILLVLLSSDTVLAYKMRNQLGRFASTSTSASSSHSIETEVPADLIAGARCEVALSDELSRRGTVRFVGPTEFGAKDDSVWVGVEWDEPVGKGNGT